jgi:hypothetical protein
VEQIEATEAPGKGPSETIPASVIRRPDDAPAHAKLTPVQHEPCPTCAAAGANTPPSHVYALGKIEPRFSKLSVEKEFAQAMGRTETPQLADLAALRKVLEENRYLVRQVCWVMTIGGLETYLLAPRDPADSQLLVESLRSRSNPGDVDLVIGMRGPLAPPEMCNGLIVPIVGFDQIYSFDRNALIEAAERTEEKLPDKFKESAEEVFDRIMQLTDNAGATDEHRALNYLAVRYPAIYVRVAEAHARNLSLTAVDVRPSSLSSVRTVVEVIFSFTHRTHDVVEKQFTRVDVTEEFPFLVTKMSPTDRSCVLPGAVPLSNVRFRYPDRPKYLGTPVLHDFPIDEAVPTH